MSMPPAECTERHSKKRFVVEENRSKVVFENAKRHEIDQIEVDGCAIVEGLRCDWLINADATQQSVFVELKGSNVPHAVEQLTHAHDGLREIRKPNVTWIVSSQRCPLTSTEVQSLTIKLRKRKGVQLIVRNSPVTFVLDQ
ncbi:MAG TPA: hypothetical protein VFJ16_01595 [Longimicrobium sp.]|nr:hypothetical protein [Longimicrobium sp.]